MPQHIHITQIKSAIGYTKNQKATIKALGLTKLHQTVKHKPTPPILGMIKTVKHLLHVQETQ